MSRKRYNGLMRELARRLRVRYGGSAKLGEVLKNYRSSNVPIGVKNGYSYDECWKMLKNARLLVDMWEVSNVR